MDMSLEQSWKSTEDSYQASIAQLGRNCLTEQQRGEKLLVYCKDGSVRFAVKFETTCANVGQKVLQSLGRFFQRLYYGWDNTDLDGEKLKNSLRTLRVLGGENRAITSCKQKYLLIVKALLGHVSENLNRHRALSTFIHELDAPEPNPCPVPNEGSGEQKPASLPPPLTFEQQAQFFGTDLESSPPVLSPLELNRLSDPRGTQSN